MKRIISFALTLAMLISFAGTAVFAASDRVKITRINIHASVKFVKVDRTLTLEERIYPDDADYDEVEWDSSDYSVAEVDDYGEVTGVSPGVATITVRVYYENKRVGLHSIDIVVPGRASDGTVYNANGSSEEASSSSVSSRRSSSSSKSSGSSKTSTEKISAAEITSAVKKNVKKGATTSATFKGATSVSAASLQSAALAMQNAGGTVLLNFDTLNGKSVEGRLTINPSSAAKLTKDTKLGVYTSDSTTEKAKEKLQGYTGNKIALVRTAHSGSYGMTVGIVAKVGTSLAKSKDLRLYSYNTSTNDYKEIKNSGIRIDSDGYARFNTTTGGYLIISDGALKMR